MTDNKITPEQLVREWLPDYEERWVGSIRRGRPFGKDRTISSIAENYRDNFPVIHIHFCHKHFPEALEAFARHVWDQACEEQRVICQDIFDSRYKAEQVEDLYYRRRISCAVCPSNDTARKRGSISRKTMNKVIEICEKNTY